jgi:hypothetical protein
MKHAVEKPEKRGAPRIPVSLTAHCRIGERYVKDDIGDLSERGLFLRTREPAREGTPVRVAVGLPAREGTRFCTLVGFVAREHRDMHGLLLGLGVRLCEETGENDRQSLGEFLSAH